MSHAVLACISIACGFADPPGWKLVWSDEFDGAAIDRKKWDFDLGNGFWSKEGNSWIHGWGNDELQYYTDRPENASVKDGSLRIRALNEKRENFKYTSARLKTRKRDESELFAKKYGRFEFRAKLPTGQGVWPALWMMPHKDTYGGWAASGEIDVLEARGQEPSKILGTLHYGSRWPANTHSERNTVMPKGGTIADFHTYTLEWEPGEMRWFVDEHRYAVQNFWWSSKSKSGNAGAQPKSAHDLNPWPAPFDQPFYLIMNVAVGGKFLGNPNESTRFPVEMQVDYVRVYDRISGYGAVKARGPGKLPFGK